MMAGRAGCVVFFCKQKTAYEMRISDWSSDVCSSDLSSLPSGKAVGNEQQPSGDVAALQSAVRLGRLGERQGPGKDRRNPSRREQEIGRASCRERVCQYV